MLAQASSIEALLDVETLHSKHCAQKGTEGKTGRAPAIPSAVLRRRISRTKSHLGWHWPFRPTRMACRHMFLKGAAFCQRTLPRPESWTVALRHGQLAICCHLDRHELPAMLFTPYNRSRAGPGVIGAFCRVGKTGKQAIKTSAVPEHSTPNRTHWLIRNADSQAVANAIGVFRSSNRNSVYSDPELLELNTFESAPKWGAAWLRCPSLPCNMIHTLVPSAAMDKGTHPALFPGHDSTQTSKKQQHE